MRLLSPHRREPAPCDLHGDVTAMVERTLKVAGDHHATVAMSTGGLRNGLSRLADDLRR